MPKRPDTPITEQDRRRVRQVRLAAIVMSVTMVAWIAGQYVGGQMGWPVRFASRLDLAGIAGLVWSLSVTYFVWKAGRRS